MVNPNKNDDETGTNLAAFIRESTPEADYIHVYGEVDISNVDELETLLGLPHMLGRPLLVDLSACTYMDSSGLTVLVRAKKRLSDDFKVLVKDNPSIDRLLRLTALVGVLT